MNSSNFCVLLTVSVLFSLVLPATAVEQRNYTSYVEECLNTLIENGTDGYGEKKSPIFVSILDLDTLTCPQDPLPLDESTGKFWGALKTDGSVIPGPRLAANAEYGVYEPRGHLDLWEPYVAGYQFPIYTAQLYVWAYELTREPVFLEAARRFAAWIEKAPPGTMEQVVTWYAAYIQGPGR